MPIVLGSSSGKLSFSAGDMNTLTAMLNVELHLFNVKAFQDFMFPKLRLNVANDLREFLELLDSTSLNYFQRIVKCPGPTVDDIMTFLDGTEIVQNFLTLTGPSCRIGLPLVMVKPSSPPSPSAVWVPPPPVVHPGWPAGYSPFKPGGYAPAPAKVIPHPGVGMMGPFPFVFHVGGGGFSGGLPGGHFG